jgi:histidine triad (HIT) family protein
MNDCIFCQIANGDTENLLWESDAIAAFRDIKPKAPTHILIVPKKHIDRLDELDDAELGGELLMAARTVAKLQGVEGNYRLSTNNGEGAGQVVNHLHFHLLSGMSPHHEVAT